MREFETGATRDDDATKPDYRGLLSPQVLQRFGQYMSEHRKQADGKLRDFDNWKKGMPQRAYLSSLLRHTVDLWALLDQSTPLAKFPEVEDLLCAVLFNVQGLLHERLLGRDVGQGAPVQVGEVAPKLLSFESWLRTGPPSPSPNGHSSQYHIPCATHGSPQLCDYWPSYRAYLRGESGVAK